MNDKNGIDLPDWMLDKVTVNEQKFCRMFTERHPLKCIGGQFFDHDGEVDENMDAGEFRKTPKKKGRWILPVVLRALLLMKY